MMTLWLGILWIIMLFTIMGLIPAAVVAAWKVSRWQGILVAWVMGLILCLLCAASVQIYSMGKLFG